MASKRLWLGALICLPVLAGCHTDPFSMKPEVPGVQIPERPASEAPAETDEDADPANG